MISWSASSVRVKQQDRFKVKNLGATGSKTLRSLIRIRSGGLILHNVSLINISRSFGYKENPFGIVLTSEIRAIV